MKNVIITADIHLACYTQYNLFGDPKFRDKQFIKFAHRLVDVAKENKSKTLIIAGDLIERPLLASEEQHLLVDFIDVLFDYFDNIYYINGNHDLAHRQDKVEYNDSVVNIFDRFEKMHYMHNKSIKIFDKTFFFRDYIHGDIPPCPEGTDVFIGHITIGGGPLKGQTFLDKESFKICIAGDIHKPIDNGKIHSVGCPLQKNLSDPPDGTIGILDVETLDFRRVKTATEKCRFLRIYRAGEEIDPDEYTQIVNKIDKLQTITIENDVGEKLKVSINNINDLIEQNVSSFSDIHNKFKLEVPSVDPIDLNFNLKNLQVKNFKSIKDFSFNFEENKGAKRVYGKNGSGKSAIINALKVALIGEKRIKSLQKADELTDKLFLEVDLTYQGVDYKIERSIGKTQFYINGVKSNGSGKKDTEESILKSLPFLKYIDLFFLSHNNKFFERFKESKLIDNLFGLDALVGYFELAEKEILSKKREQKYIEEEISRLKGSIDILDNEINETKILVDKYSVTEESYLNAIKNTQEVNHKVELINVAKGNLKYQEEISKNETNPYKKSSNIEYVLSRGKELKKSLEIKEKIQSYSLKIKTMKTRIEESRVKCLFCGKTQNQEDIDKFTLKLEELIKDKEGFVDELEFMTEDEINEEILTLRKEYEENSKYENFEKTINASKDLIEDLNESIKKHSEDLDVLLSGQSLEHKLSENNEIITAYQNLKTLMSTLNRQLKKKEDINEKFLDALNNKEANANNILRLISYKKIFDKESDESIYKKIIKVISDTLSDDEIKFYPEDGELIFMIKVGDLWIDFDNASEGQKSLMDLLLLQRMTQLIPNIGLLVFDEVGASLDSSKWSRLSQIMSEFTPNDLFVISHSELFAGIGRGIEVRLENNTSVFTLV